MKKGLERLVPYIPVVNEDTGERLKTVNWGDWGYVATGNIMFRVAYIISIS